MKRNTPSAVIWNDLNFLWQNIIVNWNDI
jgi:hypothetical protein